MKTSLSMVKNGMGVELIERDENYLDFVKTINGEDKERKNETGAQSGEGKVHHPEGKGDEIPDSRIVVCVNCETKNRIPKGKVPLGAKCGKCGTLLYLGDMD